MSQGSFRFSPAVANDRIEPPDSLDFFPTPPWATRAFVKHVAMPILGADPEDLVKDPACGEGHMAEPLKETFRFTIASDIHPYGYSRNVEDFLTSEEDWQADWIFTNPPFNAGIAFARKALAVSVKGCALLVRPGWLHTLDRYDLFGEFPPSLIAYYVERVPMHRGRWEPDGSTASDYLWVCWAKHLPPQPPFWIPPGNREALTRPDDAARFARPAPAPLLDGGG